MIPWPIALLTLYYAVIATLAGASAWQIVNGLSQRPLWSQVAWLVLCGGAMIGLPLLKSWGRRLAIIAAVALGLTTLAVAAGLVAMHRPGLGLVAAFTVAAPALVIRYLQRPTVKTWFV